MAHDRLTIRVERTSLFWPVLLVILAFMYWKWVLFVVGTIAALFLFWYAVRCLRSDMRDQKNLEAARQERLRRNATIENDLFHRGDPRGMLGLDYTNGKEPGS